MATGRHVNNQPTYDFLSGAVSPPAPQPLRETFRQSQIIKPGVSRGNKAHVQTELISLDLGNENLRAEVKTLQYELQTVRQERELATLRHEKELRELQKKAEDDNKRAQLSDNGNHVSSSKYDLLAKELREIQDQSAIEKTNLEKKLRSSQDQNRTLHEEIDEVQNELSSQERQYKYQLKEVETRHSTLKRTAEDLSDDLEGKNTALQATQQRLSQKEAEVGHLESEVLRLKAQTGDADTLNVIKRELSEQVTHIKKLEATNREQLVQLKHFRKVHENVEIVEEEKKALEGKVMMMNDLSRELGEARLQRQILEDERKSWTTYLHNESSVGGKVEFDSPEALARALVQERLETASMIERLGRVEPELSEKDEIIKSLESERRKLQSEMEKLRLGGGGGESRLRSRLERQRALAVKEVEYLRAQLKTFDAEDSTFQLGNFDEQKSKRIQELEDLVDQYRKELQTQNEELAKRDDQAPTSEPAGTKRPREEEPDERLGLLSRKNRKLQDEISKLNQSSALLRKELDVHKTQLSSLKTTSRTRILELRSNPTADAEAIKLSTLTALRTENKALLAELEGRHDTQVVPISTLENMRMEVDEMALTLTDKEKGFTRMRKIFTDKSMEFKETVASVLGWDLSFMPPNRVRVTSLFNPGEEEEDNSIIFNGESGIMNISGGPNSLFGLEIRDLIKFWVEERKEVPCLLAAMTLQFYEKSTRAVRAVQA
ncbi:MAG: coiled-coil domain-containing protein mad1 [Pycnora praestabilis]|nr:MAG: coiled-coil domain-containing protein mad1 [Pycnora praestabilis]